MYDWDVYWSSKKKTTNILYDKVALFYRKFIIPRMLNFFLEKTYMSGSVLLHAGCGNGDVDEKANKRFKLASLDNSEVALSTNNSSRMLIRGDIFHLPIRTGSVDGIYSLGLMEHFTESKIVEMLKEFGRALKSRGKIILFWPPEFGLSVIFLKVVHFILNNIFRINIRLYPEEITRLRSYSHAKFLCDKANFKIIYYYFGPKDFFTYSVITIQKDS